MQYDPQGYPKEPGVVVKVYLQDILLNFSLLTFLGKSPSQTLTIRRYFLLSRVNGNITSVDTSIPGSIYDLWYTHLLQRIRSKMPGLNPSTRTVVVERRHKSIRDPTYYGARTADYRRGYSVSVQRPISPCVPVGRAGSTLGGLEPMHNPSWVGIGECRSRGNSSSDRQDACGSLRVTLFSCEIALAKPWRSILTFWPLNQLDLLIIWAVSQCRHLVLFCARLQAVFAC